MQAAWTRSTSCAVVWAFQMSKSQGGSCQDTTSSGLTASKKYCVTSPRPIMTLYSIRSLMNPDQDHQELTGNQFYVVVLFLV